MSILEQIFQHKRLEVTRRQAERPEAELRRSVEDLAPPPDFVAVLTPTGGSPALIAEIKRRSPSKGDLTSDFDPVHLALQYASGGAAAVSVLTDAAFFGGSLEDLSRVDQALQQAGMRLPLLCKDFVFSVYQLLEARAAGASAVLLIAAMLDPKELRFLHREAERLNLAALVETHTAEEIARAVEAGARLIGINNRDLHTFREDLGATLRLRPLVPAGCTVVAESGIRTTEDMRRMAEARVDAVLVGEALVRAANPESMVRQLHGGLA